MRNNFTAEEWKNNTVCSLDKQFCVGCGACVSACPTKAISLVEDSAGYYRAQLDAKKCVNCGKCKNVCPALELPQRTNDIPTCFAFQSANKDILNKSTSGGIFYELASLVLEKSGVVFGAAWNEDFSVRHIAVEDISDLPKLQKSKYLQSYLGDTFLKVQKCLNVGKQVLFSGCPCQIAGLKKFLGKEYDNLLLVDLLCGNAPSKNFFQKYLDENFGRENVDSYNFRDKTDGWKPDYVVVVVLKNGERLIRHGIQDEYQAVYHNHTLCPKHCENCKYQTVPRYGDLTIGDFWGIEKKDTSLDTYDGVSVVLENNEKGRRILEAIPKSRINYLKKEPLEYLGGNGITHGQNWASPNRDKFYGLISTNTFHGTLLASRNDCFLKGISSLGLGENTRIKDIVARMPDNSVFCQAVGGIGKPIADVPKPFGVLQITKTTNYFVQITFSRMTIENEPPTLYLAQWLDGDIKGWIKFVGEKI